MAHRALHGVDERALARILSAHLLTANACSEHTDPSLGGLKARIQVHRHMHMHWILKLGMEPALIMGAEIAAMQRTPQTGCSVPPAVRALHNTMQSGPSAVDVTDDMRFARAAESSHHPDVAGGADFTVQAYEQLLHAPALESAHQLHRDRLGHTSLLCAHPYPLLLHTSRRCSATSTSPIALSQGGLSEAAVSQKLMVLAVALPLKRACSIIFEETPIIIMSAVPFGVVRGCNA
jgi:hypothetical protein